MGDPTQKRTKLHEDLRWLIRSKGLTQRKVADAAGMALGTFTAKLSGKHSFTEKEMFMIAAFLWQEPGQIKALFPETEEMEDFK